MCSPRCVRGDSPSEYPRRGLRPRNIHVVASASTALGISTSWPRRRCGHGAAATADTNPSRPTRRLTSQAPTRRSSRARSTSCACSSPPTIRRRRRRAISWSRRAWAARVRTLSEFPRPRPRRGRDPSPRNFRVHGRGGAATRPLGIFASTAAAGPRPAPLGISPTCPLPQAATPARLHERGHLPRPARQGLATEPDHRPALAVDPVHAQLGEDEGHPDRQLRARRVLAGQGAGGVDVS